MSNVTEILKVCKELGITCYLLEKKEALEVIEKAISIFKPFKITGHLAIGNDSTSIPLEENEFSYSEVLDAEPIHMFFDQGGVDQNKVILIENAKNICKIMEESYGMEYFISHNLGDYLIAVNWYVIEVKGSVKEKFSKL